MTPCKHTAVTWDRQIDYWVCTECHESFSVPPYTSEIGFRGQNIIFEKQPKPVKNFRRRIEVICACGLIMWFFAILLRQDGTPGWELGIFALALLVVAGWVK